MVLAGASVRLPATVSSPLSRDMTVLFIYSPIGSCSGECRPINTTRNNLHANRITPFRDTGPLPHTRTKSGVSFGHIVRKGGAE